MTCGTEHQDLAGRFAAKILGATTYDTTPVLASSPGALELLPNHLYPGPWLHVAVAQPSAPGRREHVLEYLRLPNEEQPNPYVLYRDMTPWFRLVDPALADPAGKYRLKKGGVEKAIKEAIDAAERFHVRQLGDFYHPNTYAFYASDPDHSAFGQVRWLGRKESGSGAVLTRSNVSRAKFIRHHPDGERVVAVDPGFAVRFVPEPPDSRGDGTVPGQSGVGPGGKVQLLFETRGYDHQTSFKNDSMLMLTLRLIVRIVQGLP
jgi:hypothetical protein